MNKKHQIIIIATFLLTLILVGGTALYLFFLNNARYNVYKTSNDEYKVKICRIGNKLLPMGESSAIIKIYDKEYHTYVADVEVYDIDNHGDEATADNFDVQFMDEYIHIDILDYNGEVDYTYRFYYDDLDEVAKGRKWKRK